VAGISLFPLKRETVLAVFLFGLVYPVFEGYFVEVGCDSDFNEIC